MAGGARAVVFVCVCAFILTAQKNTTVAQTFKTGRKTNQSPTTLTTNFPIFLSRDASHFCHYPSPQKTPYKLPTACTSGLVPACSHESEAPESAEPGNYGTWFRPCGCGHGAYGLPGIPPHPRQCKERDAGEIQAGGEAARLKREIQGGFLEEVVVEQDVSGWQMREAAGKPCISVSECSLVPLKFASSLWPHVSCFL